MNKIHYEIGFTDEIYDGLVPSDMHNGETNFNYNLRVSDTKKEKEKLVWEMHDTPVARAMIDRWEYTIRSPFLLMCSLNKQPNHHLSDENDLTINWEYINLIPLKREIYELTKEDAAQIEISQPQFGDLYLPYHSMIQRHYDDQIAHWRGALHNNDLRHLEPGPVVLDAMPGFQCSLNLNRPQSRRTTMRPFDLKWMRDEEDKLAALNYYPTDPLCKVGNIKIGELVTDPLEAREIVDANNYMCRHSIISDVMHKKEKK